MATTHSVEDYTHLLNSAYWAFIHRVNAYFPATDSALSVAQQRTAYHARLASFATQLPEQVTIQDSQLTTAQGLIPLRSYQLNNQTPKAHILYFHGGGFVLGGLDSHQGICAELCAATGFRLTAVDYRLAPEHLFPAALEDAVQAYQAIAAQENLPLILMGDSAGGCLAAHVAHQSRSSANKPLAQVLIYPVLGSDLSLISYQRYAFAPLLTTEDMQHYWRLWLGTETIPKQLAGMPLAEQSFRDLPKTIIFSAEFDPLVGDAELYCAQVQVAGGETHWHEEKGLTHSYLHARHHVASAQASFARIQAALSALVA